MKLPQETIDFIGQNSEIEYQVYFDHRDGLSEQQVNKIVNAESKDEIFDILSEIENEIADGHLDYTSERKDEFKEEMIKKFNLDEDDEELMSDLEDRLEDVCVNVSVDAMELVKKYGSVHLTVAVAAKENPKYWEDDYLMLPGMYRDSISDSDENKQILSDVCAILGIDKADMEVAYSKYHNLEEALVLPEPTIEVGAQQTTAEKFIYDWENNTTDYGVLSFMTRIDLYDYVKNFDRIKQDGIQIPAGTYCGLHDPMQGACSLMEIELKHPISLGSNRIEISAGDRSHNHGYSIESICGLHEDAWGLRDAYAGVFRTDKESGLITKLQDLIKERKRETKGFVGFFLASAESLLSGIRQGDIDARVGIRQADIQNHIKECADNFYWFKNEYTDEQREKMANDSTSILSDYISGKIDKDFAFTLAKTCDEYLFASKQEISDLFDSSNNASVENPSSIKP